MAGDNILSLANLLGLCPHSSSRYCHTQSLSGYFGKPS